MSWRLLAFGGDEWLVTEITLTDEQAEALKKCTAIVDTDDHFGSYPVHENVTWFLEER